MRASQTWCVLEQISLCGCRLCSRIATAAHAACALQPAVGPARRAVLGVALLPVAPHAAVLRLAGERGPLLPALMRQCVAATPRFAEGYVHQVAHWSGRDFVRARGYPFLFVAAGRLGLPLVPLCCEMV